VVVTVAVAWPLVVPAESATSEPPVMEQPGASPDWLDGPPVREQVRVTLPVYPPLPATVTVEVAGPPGEIEPEGEVALTVYAEAAAAFTVTLTVAVCVIGPEFPVTVMT
jgi:hypothetical protein